VIEKLTKKQEAKLVEYRQKYFDQATSTERADRERAELAARRLAELGDVKVEEVVWVSSSQEGKEKYDSIRKSPCDSFRAFLWDSLRSLLKSSLLDSLWGSLRGSLWDSLWDSFWESFNDLLKVSFGVSLRDSFLDSINDSGFLALATFAVEELGVEISTEDQEKLHLANEILSSCFALWVVPGSMILCERPKSVEVGDGKLIGMEW
jgi:hypothetical protein